MSEENYLNSNFQKSFNSDIQNCSDMGEIEQLFLLANNSCMIESRVKFFFFMRFDDFFSCFIMVIFVVVVFFNFFFRFSVLFFFWFHSSGVGSFSRVCGIFEGGSCLFVDGVLARIPFSQHAFLLEPGEFSPVVNCCEYFPHEN